MPSTNAGYFTPKLDVRLVRAFVRTNIHLQNVSVALHLDGHPTLMRDIYGADEPVSGAELTASVRITLGRQTAPSIKVAVATVERSTMTPSGKGKARHLLEICEGSGFAGELVACPTGDDGMTIELVKDETGRDLLFALPDDGAELYFTARANGGFRKAGIVSDSAAILDLIKWTEIAKTKFPLNGLRIG
jgi:hypothetical protein